LKKSKEKNEFKNYKKKWKDKSLNKKLAIIKKLKNVKRDLNS